MPDVVPLVVPEVLPLPLLPDVLQFIKPGTLHCYENPPKSRLSRSRRHFSGVFALDALPFTNRLATGILLLYVTLLLPLLFPES